MVLPAPRPSTQYNIFCFVQVCFSSECLLASGSVSGRRTGSQCPRSSLMIRLIVLGSEPCSQASGRQSLLILLDKVFVLILLDKVFDAIDESLDRGLLSLLGTRQSRFCSGWPRYLEQLPGRWRREKLSHQLLTIRLTILLLISSISILWRSNLFMRTIALSRFLYNLVHNFCTKQ